MTIREKVLNFLGSVENATVSEIASAIGSNYQTARTEINQLMADGAINKAIEKEITLVYSVAR